MKMHKCRYCKSEAEVTVRNIAGFFFAVCESEKCQLRPLSNGKATEAEAWKQLVEENLARV